MANISEVYRSKDGKYVGITVEDFLRDSKTLCAWATSRVVCLDLDGNIFLHKDSRLHPGRNAENIITQVKVEKTIAGKPTLTLPLTAKLSFTTLYGHEPMDDYIPVGRVLANGFDSVPGS